MNILRFGWSELSALNLKAIILHKLSMNITGYNRCIYRHLNDFVKTQTDRLSLKESPVIYLFYARNLATSLHSNNGIKRNATQRLQPYPIIRFAFHDTEKRYSPKTYPW